MPNDLLNSLYKCVYSNLSSHYFLRLKERCDPHDSVMCLIMCQAWPHDVMFAWVTQVTDEWFVYLFYFILFYWAIFYYSWLPLLFGIRILESINGFYVSLLIIMGPKNPPPHRVRGGVDLFLYKNLIFNSWMRKQLQSGFLAFGGKTHSVGRSMGCRLSSR